ncbi:MAG: SAM hydrolase/SAM-dependent halogenase family protein [Gammaproteobacteria bacterium]
MLVLFTDFGPYGPYLAQMQAVLCRQAPQVPVLSLLCDAPRFNPRASAYLLAAYAGDFPTATVFLCVVDPGVGTNRDPLMVNVDGQWFVGPGNGLFRIIMRRGKTVRARRILWRPERLSCSFHGRDLFAPVAALLAVGREPASEPWFDPAADAWPDELTEVVYIDYFGNALTGLRAASIPNDAVIEVDGRPLVRAGTFGEVAAGQAFWYENANGLVEIAVNRGSAAAALGIAVGTRVVTASPA